MTFRPFSYSTTVVVTLVLLASCSTTKDSGSQPDSTQIASGDTRVPADPDHFYVVPGEKAGFVQAESSEESLLAMLGADNVRRDTIYIGEGESQTGTTLYKGTPDEAQIIWQDTVTHSRPELVRLIPAESPEATRWRLENGIRVGSTLKEVEQLNGKPFELYGFGWDYGGTVADWKGGRLSYSTAGKTYLGAIFVYDQSDPEQQALVSKVMGDNTFLSDNPAMQQLNPRVYSLIIKFR